MPLLKPAIPIAFGLGLWFGSDPARLIKVRAHGEAAIRASRLLICGIGIAREYRAARCWKDNESEAIQVLQSEHLKVQREAARAEHERSTASPSERSAAIAEAQRTRDAALRLGEELARARVSHASESDLASRWATLHERSAERLRAMCLSNGGLYCKIGQFVAQLDYIVPEPYTRVLSTLFEHNASSPPEAVAALVAEELGCDRVSDAFESFSPDPIASASLAQVHAAVERGSGRKLAVKVQHPRLREASAADLAAVSLAVRACVWAFPDEFRLAWVMDELAPHLPQELDFEHEAKNLERTRAFFAAGGGGSALRECVSLPEVVPHLSSQRVLTMTFEEGARVTDAATLRRMGLSPASVTRLLSECFCAQIFCGGFVHADPHPGNVLIRPRPDAPHEPMLVLLDHGLYRDLPSHFTLLYARLWQSCLLGDADGIKSVSSELGVGQLYPLLAAMLTGRPWAEIIASDASMKRLEERGTAEDKAQIRGYAQQYLRHIVRVLERVPPPMLLLFKTNDCLRHTERQLGGIGAHSFLVTLRYCLRALLKHDSVHRHHGGVRSRLRRLRVRLALWLLSLVSESSLVGPRLLRLLLKAEC
jgi:aarF domain-containing kinase